jgi:hypothetical protein
MSISMAEFHARLRRISMAKYRAEELFLAIKKATPENVDGDVLMAELRDLLIAELGARNNVRRKSARKPEQS